jgi:hypothetical protein
MLDRNSVSNPPKESSPLQFKRGNSKAFRKVDPVLLEGQPAYEIDTRKLKVGDGVTRYNKLPYIGDHTAPKDGKSAYQIWKEQGYEGDINDFLEYCVGEDGKSTYEIWLSLGNEGGLVDFINSLHGINGLNGKSAYELWIDEGNTGTITDYLQSLHGASAYEIWLSLGNEGSEADFMDSLRGKSAYQIWLDNGNSGTEEQFLASLVGKSAYEVWKEQTGNEDATPDDYVNAMRSTTWGQF